MKDERIKIAYLIHSSEIGGAEKMLLLMLGMLDRDVFSDPVVLTTRGEGRFTEELRRSGAELYVYNLRNPFSMLRMVLFLRRRRPDILHSFLFCANISARFSRVFLRGTVILSSQRSADSWRRWYHWKLDRLTARWSDAIVSNSFAGRDVLVERGVACRDRIPVIHNGVPTVKEGSAGGGEILNVEAGSDLIVGTVGNLRPAKGHRHLINAASLILARRGGVKFVVVGEGALKDRLLRQAGALGISDRFIFAGYIRNAAEIIDEFDVFVMSSEWEGCPVVLLEAMAAGKPCVASPVGDIPLIIRDGYNGFIADPHNTEAFADAIYSLLLDKSLRREIGLKARETVERHFSAGRMVSAYEKLYFKLLREA